MYFRTNNGVIQVGASTASATSSIWYQSGGDVLLSTSTADSVSPNGIYYTDLGTSTNPWKDLYLGNGGLLTSISAGNGLQVYESNGMVLTAGADVISSSPIIIYNDSNPVSKTRPLFLNSRYSTINPSSQVVVASSVNTIVGTGSNTVFIGAGSDVEIVEGASNVAHLGYGYNKKNYNSNEVVVGNLAVRGLDDDGSGQYDRSDWTTNQSRVTTTDATTVDLAFIPWVDQSSWGEVVQVKAFIIGCPTDTPTSVYSCEISGTYFVDGTGTASAVSDPVVIEMNSFDPALSSFPPLVDMFADSLGVYIKLTGPSLCIAKWLCTFSYHRLIKIQP